MERNRQDKITALVTGAAKGIGEQFAIQLAERGYDLILVDKDPAVEKTGSSICESHPALTVRSIIFDLARKTAADELFNNVLRHGERVDVLINCAGIFSFCDICNADDGFIEKIITLHNLTLTRLCRLFGTEMARRGGGHILNMSSFSVWMPMPGLALYCATKSYIRTFSIAFSKEVREKNVYVTAICPSAVATDLYGLGKKFQALGLKTGILITPENCVRRSLKALFRHKRVSVPDWWNCLLIPILTHLPTWMENIIRKKTMRFQK